MLEEIKNYCKDELGEFNNTFSNHRKSIITTVAYLIGVDDEKLTCEERFDVLEYNKLKTNEEATIIKYLCRLRTQFFRNYKSIDDARKFNMRSLDDLSEYLDVEGITYLRSKQIEINSTSKKTPSIIIANLNQYILDNIDKVKSLFPDWIKFEYIKSLFLMPGGYAGHNGINLKTNSQKIYNIIFEENKAYGRQRSLFPYQMYINWPYPFRETDGNILFNDLKFLKMLYGAFNDRFQASGYVVDAHTDTKEDIYTFLDESNNVSIFVDCENVDPYAFCATLLNLDKDIISKIKKIVLYDDVNTSTAWDYITKILSIPVDKKDIQRVLDNKSLIDITMTAGVCKAYYSENMDSIILASSDSDFWGLIKQLPEAHFLVLNEHYKTSSAIIEQMNQNNIKHCYMNDFAQDIIQKFKFEVLFKGLLKHVNHFNETGEFIYLNVDELLEELFFDANILGAEGQIKKEKEAFYNKYLKNGLLLKPVNENGKLRFKIELYKK